MHAKTVAEVMSKLSNGDGRMYVLGLLHDIGKTIDSQDHGMSGAALLESMGFQYHREVYYHGIPQDEYSSLALDLLNAADLSVDSCGNLVGYKKRIDDIGKRYGRDSKEYENAKKLSCTLKHILDQISVE